MAVEEPAQAYARLDRLVTSESARADVANDKLHQATLDIAKDKTQYVEKIAFGAGATVAAIVSFVGAHASTAKLHPTWLLRLSLVCFVLTIAGLLYRNWRYPFYQYVFHVRLHQEAAMRREIAKAQYALRFPVIDFNTGQLFDPVQFAAESRDETDAMRSSIDKLLRREDWIFRETQIIEVVSLLLAASGMILLVLLAWFNF